jgi:hypothetical protein
MAIIGLVADTKKPAAVGGLLAPVPAGAVRQRLAYSSTSRTPWVSLPFS